jgi:hypothetical protein
MTAAAIEIGLLLHKRLKGNVNIFFRLSRNVHCKFDQVGISMIGFIYISVIHDDTNKTLSCIMACTNRFMCCSLVHKVILNKLS